MTSQSTADVASNKSLAIKAMNEAFIERDLGAVDRYWSKNYIQHNPGISNGTVELAAMLQGAGEDFEYQMGLVVAEGDFVMIHGRYIGMGPKPMVAVDIFRVKDGVLAEHWDVLQEEISADQTKSKNPMFAPGS